jgi:CRP-like cAMP-binding protein
MSQAPSHDDRDALTDPLSSADPPSSDSAERWADQLQELPLFADVPKRRVRKIARLGHIARYPADAAIVTAGGPGEAFYVVLTGLVAVDTAPGRPAVELGPGGCFGEMALLDDAPRSASVTATRETTCLLLGRDAFDTILSTEPAIGSKLLRTLAARLREVSDA